MNKKILLYLLAAAPCLAQSVLNSCSDQGWDQQTRQSFWSISQGSELLPRTWFEALERADSPGLFSSSLERYGFIPWGKRFIGIETTEDDFAGLTCAACHTTRITRKDGTSCIVDGGPAMICFDRFFNELVDAVNATLADEARFQRFEAALPQPPPANLRTSLQARSEQLNYRRKSNIEATLTGFGRLDAVGHILNHVMGVHLGQQGNEEPLAAPVSYPALWGSPHFRNVQWTGVAANLGLLGTGSLVRNIGEVLGVFGTANVTDPESYKSSANLPNLKIIERWVSTLKAPSLNAPSNDRGREIYDRTCAECHHRKELHRIELTEVSKVGTDRGLSDLIRYRNGPAGPLAGRPSLINARNPFYRFSRVNPEPALDLASHIAVKLVRSQPPAEQPSAATNALDAIAAFWNPPPMDRYKARPLDGIWATAPYLHNGSVPTVADLLKPPKDRPSRFCIENYVYDDVNVGVEYKPECSTVNGAVIDQSEHKGGNGNGGHLYGTTLPAEDKLNLLAFLKTL